jgi:poly(A) polymerase
MAKILKNTQKIFDRLWETAQEMNMQVYVVGGYVRDLLLDKPGKDIDFVVIGDALAFATKFAARHKTTALVKYPKFETCMFNHQGYKLEFVSARQEQYQPDSRKPSVEKADLESDLSRRDFTVNALAMEIGGPDAGKIHDRYNGLKDLEKGIIRTPLDPDQTFSDDPLRMMRAVRFATRLNFKIDKKTLAGISANAERLAIISQERITDELNKILLAEKPSVGFKLMMDTGLLHQFLPEFVDTHGVEQRKDHHHKDVFYHTLQVIDQVAERSPLLELRLAALFHDIAKPRTKRFDEASGWTFHGHEVVGERMTRAILRKLKYSNEIIQYVQKLVRLHLRPMALVSEEVTDSAIRRLLFLAGEEFDDLMQLCRADITSKNPDKVRRHLKNYEYVIQRAGEVEEKDRMRAFKSPVNGVEIMEKLGIRPGPEIGKLKTLIEEAIIEGIIPNEHDAAWDYLLANYKEMS